MNDSKTQYLAQFDSSEALLDAVQQLRDEGWDQMEAFSPFPIHGLDEALGVKPTKLPWMVLLAGIVGCVVAIVGQWWMNAVDYPYIISGKPLFSFPASVPIAFELTILFAAFAAFFGMLRLAELPRLYNPLLAHEALARVSVDRFVLAISGDSEAGEQLVPLLESAGALKTDSFSLPSVEARLPRILPMTLAVVGALAILPPMYIFRARVTKSEKPPLTWFSDMDHQPKFKAQSRSPLFKDNRAMRPTPTGVVARGEYFKDDSFTTGRLDIRDEEPMGKSGGEPDEWTNEIPLVATNERMKEGRKFYNITCATCHGRAGYGNGPVSVRALSLEQGTWVPPTSLHAPHVREQPHGQLFNTITHGIRKMPGYGDHLTPEQRWAVVMYVRALQRSQNASPNDLRPSELPTLRDLK